MTKLSNREFDAIVAEEVMGVCGGILRVDEKPPHEDSFDFEIRYTCVKCGRPFHRYDFEDGNVREQPHCLKYTANILYAWRVVEKMKAYGWSFALWDVPLISSVQMGPLAAFRKSVYPPEREHPGRYMNNRATDTCKCCDTYFGWGVVLDNSVSAAICLAAVNAVRGERSDETKVHS